MFRQPFNTFMRENMIRRQKYLLSEKSWKICFVNFGSFLMCEIMLDIKKILWKLYCKKKLIGTIFWCELKPEILGRITEQFVLDEYVIQRHWWWSWLSRNRELWADHAWPGHTWPGAGKSFPSDHPEIQEITKNLFFLLKKWTWSWTTSPYSGCSTTVPLQANSFLATFTIFLKSYSEDSPCTVVRVFLPFLCWILMWTNPSWTDSSSPLFASAKGSNAFKFSIWDIFKSENNHILLITATKTKIQFKWVSWWFCEHGFRNSLIPINKIKQCWGKKLGSK